MCFSLKSGLVHRVLVVVGLVVSSSLVGLCLFSAVASALSPGRAYEMVSPVYKGGFGATKLANNPPILAVSLDGESVAFYSTGTFAGNPYSGGAYLARRGADGWSTTPLAAPATLTPNDTISTEVSPTLGLVLKIAAPGSNEESARYGSTAEFLLHRTDLPDVSADWELAGEPLQKNAGAGEGIEEVGASVDFCHIVFSLAVSGLYFLPEAEGTGHEPYEIDRGCNGSPISLRLVALNDQGKLIDPACGLAEVGDKGFTPSGSKFNAVSADGEEVFFTECLDSQAQSVGYPSTPRQLFVRLGGARTLEVSKPLSEPDTCAETSACEQDAERAGADFAGASEDGSRVFFTTAAPLVGEDHDTANDLYMASIGCAESEPGCEVAERKVVSLVQVSHDPHAGEAAEVQGAVRVAPDGERVYFVARGVLSETASSQGTLAARGADNLYVYDGVSGQTAFIGDLCSGFEASGTVFDARCPSSTETDTELWEGHNGGGLNGVGDPAQTAGADGGFLVFDTAAQLVTGDTDAARDVYRYDAVTGELDRVSIGEAGHDANGNAGSFDAAILPGNLGGSVLKQYELDTRAVSEDGSRIVFTTSAPLSPDATNGLANAYEWQADAAGGEGHVSLISGGSAESPIEDVVISPSGNDVFFVTTQGLVPQDTDGLPDVYDARLNGGFPPPAAAPAACSGDACQGPLSNPAPLLVPGSASQAPGENVPSAASGVAVASKSKPKPKPKPKPKCRRGYARDKRGKCIKVGGRARKATGAHRAAHGSIRGGRS